jgi:hypothetical protein
MEIKLYTWRGRGPVTKKTNANHQISVEEFFCFCLYLKREQARLSTFFLYEFRHEQKTFCVWFLVTS